MVSNKDGVVELSLKQVDPNKNQPRKTFEPNALKELAESIKQHGVIQPIIVNDENNGRYTIIAGERRFRASLVAGKTTIPAIIRQYTPKQIKEVALIENLQREDLNPIEAAKAIKELMEEYNFTQETVADRIGKSRPLVANTLRLLTLTPEVVTMIEKGQISAGHGKCLVTVADPTQQADIAKTVVENKLTVRDLENYIKNYKGPQEKIKKEKPIQSIELKELGHRLARLFKTKVKIVGDDRKGKITIDYFNQDDLDRICSFLNSFERR
ncbi:MAG: ParB/RepB/Spo0J family partition protein [Clostridia bacterium]|nr:ParB/RepB/Spo0J family partition protein [Clostridia bacterium]